ncbi:hypothetical protein BDW68DRAFT_189315 [Aspergillus falconensis]
MDAYAGGELITTAAAFMTLEIAFAAVRFWAARKQAMQRGLDDWFIWPALVVNIILCVEGLILIPLAGVGSHLAAVETRSPEKLAAWSKGIYACVWLWALAVALPKLAILGFYLRFFKLGHERAISYLLMLVIAATFIGTGLTATFECTPIRYQWDKTIPGGRCIDITAFYRWMSLPNIVTDVMMLLLPLPMILRLHLTRGQKLGLGMVFATGGVGMITSCLRFAIFYRHDAFKDNTWTSVQLLKWTDIEPGIYFLAACMPFFRPLVQRAWSRFVAPYVKLSRSGTGTDTDGIDNNWIALYTIGGGRRGRDPGRHSYSHTAGTFSRLSAGVDEEAGGLTRAGVVSGSDGRSAPPWEERLRGGASREIRVTDTVTIDHVRA